MKARSVHKHEVGVRQLRAELRRWLDRARKGEEIVVTDRGKPIARLSSPSARDRLQELVDAGIATPPSRKKTSLKGLRPIRAKGNISDIVIEQRR